MRKLTYLFASAATLFLASCGGNKAGYTVSGTVEDGVNGDTVFLQEVVGRQLVNLDTAIIKNGKFEFKGVQDSTVYRYLSHEKDGKDALRLDFFLENGNIAVALTKDSDTATGTSSNDAYQLIRTQIDEINKKAREIYATIDKTVPREENELKFAELGALEEQMKEITKKGIESNITNPVGIQLFKQNFYSNSVDENDAILKQIPEQYKNDETIALIQETTNKQKLTTPGQKFINFEMENPQGKMVQLSDYVGNGKVVLIDFWASWCGPCINDMPEIVELYKEYKGKNFNIVGVSLDNNGEAWKNALKKYDMTWPQMSDLKGWKNEGAQLYAVNSIPCTVLVDGDGIIIARNLRGKALAEKIAEVVK